ncbi:FAD-dependent monooxygenase [Xanthomonas campestris pv. phormiicola]|nr:FAD-dependent monooxygenase [Xanthomonas campestris pv. phormiicola]UYC14331.1 FAD-dependent monooxygenase [Xanthomonas campestris pv. phormiicola]
MTAPHVAVLGGSVAGLLSALAFARSGVRVTLIERDALGVPSVSDLRDPARVERWWRKGVPHARHTHALAALGRQLLRAHAPDVWHALLAAGAVEMPFGAQLHGQAQVPRCDDADLAGLSVRRSLVEAVLLPIVYAEPQVSVRQRTAVTGLVLDAGGAKVRGVQTSTGEVLADLTIDALGRGSPFAKWLHAAAVETPADSVERCGLSYYTRWYRLRQRPSVRLEAGFSAGGHAAASGCIVCPADNGYASVTLMVAQDDKALHAFDDPRLFVAAARQHPGLAAWLEPDVCEPVSGVLRWPVCENRFRRFARGGQPVVLGTVAVGDALCITNPTYTRGMSLAMRYVFALAELARAEGLQDLVRFAHRADRLAQRLVRPWHDDSVMQDRARNALWAGTPPAPPTTAEITLQHIAAAAGHDPLVWHALARRTGMLDPPEAIFARADVMARVQALRAQGGPPPARRPTRDDLLHLIARHDAAPCLHPLA